MPVILSCILICFYHVILHPLSSPPGASPGLRAAPILRPLRALLTCSLGPRLWGIAAVAAGPSSSSLSFPPACPRRGWIAPGWGGTSFPLRRSEVSRLSSSESRSSDEIPSSLLTRERTTPLLSRLVLGLGAEVLYCVSTSSDCSTSRSHPHSQLQVHSGKRYFHLLLLLL